MENQINIIKTTETETETTTTIIKTYELNNYGLWIEKSLKDGSIIWIEATALNRNEMIGMRVNTDNLFNPHSFDNSFKVEIKTISWGLLEIEELKEKMKLYEEAIEVAKEFQKIIDNEKGDINV